MKFRQILIFFLIFISQVRAQKLLIPMDLTQTDHLKSYGVAYHTLKRGINVEWLLNFRGGSFLTDADEETVRECRIKGVKYQLISDAQTEQIY